MVLPECALAIDGDRRLTVDLLGRSSDWTASVETANVETIEFRHFHFNQQLALEQLDRLFNSAKACKIRSLLIEDCVLSDRVVAFVVETFTPTNQLNALVVRRCRQFSMTSLMALASMIKVAPLVTLEMSTCDLARQAGIMLGQSLHTCRQLLHVNVSGNNLRDGGIKAIADGIRVAQSKGMECLDRFDCSRNGMSAIGLASLASLHIKQLVADDNAISAVNSTLFTSNTSLESLHVANIDLSDESMRNLLTHALQAPRLVELNVQNCGQSEDNDAFLTESLLVKAKSSQGCKLQSLLIGEKPNIDDLLNDADAIDSSDRFAALKECLEDRIPGLTVHILGPISLDEAQLADDRDECDPQSGCEVELLETPGRQVRRELLERTEFLRRHSEELPLSDEESTVSFVSDKLEVCTEIKPPTSRNVSPSYSQPGEGENELLSASRRPSSSFGQPRLHHSASNGSFFLNSNASLDDVASQFSIDPPPSSMTSTLQNTDVEFIVGRTIETMNRNFELRLSQFLMRMEFQQQEKNATQLQSLAAKVEACERAIPRLEARLDVLADRLATSGAQVIKMQSEWQSKHQSIGPLASTTMVTSAIQSQVDDLVTARLRSSDSHVQSELSLLRREVSSAASMTKAANPQAVVDAVSMHLTQFKQEFDANQTNVLRRFTENIAKDGVRVDARMQQLEGKVAHLEGIIQDEQHASLLALEAISEAFAGGGSASAPVAPMPQNGVPSKQPQHGYTFATR